MAKTTAITVSNKTVGSGTLLSQQDSPEIARRHHPGEAMTLQSNLRRLLFVDDEESIRLTLPPLLQTEGFEVRVAANVPEALIEINSHQFDVLITDLNISEQGDGFLVVSAMRHLQPRCVNLISGRKFTLQGDDRAAGPWLIRRVEHSVSQPAGDERVQVDSRIECLPASGHGQLRTRP